MSARRATSARALTVSVASLLALLALSGWALATGVEHIDLRRAIAQAGTPDAAILDTRLTRVILGALVGAALAPAGVAFQALLRNPLADPYVLGVSGGASVAGTAAIVLGAGAGLLGVWMLPACAFSAAVAAVAIVFALGRVRGRLAPQVALLGAYTAVGLLLLARHAVAMNAFALGDEFARSVGIDVERARRAIFLAASLLTGAAVSVAGPIGFVGIVVPHALRGILGPEHRVLLPASALLGGAFLVGADTLARLAYLVLHTELTVGVLTALVGAPFFLVVLRRRGSERLF